MSEMPLDTVVLQVQDLGLPVSRPAVTLTLADLLLRSSEQAPDAVALILPWARLTYRQLTQQAWSVACSLAALGVRPGQHVGILMMNAPEYVTALFGIAMLGGVVVPINSRYRSTELQYLVSDADLVAVLTHDRHRQHVDFGQLLAEALPGLSTAVNPRNLQLPQAPKLRFVANLGASASAGVLSLEAFQAAAKDANIELLGRWCDGVPLRRTAAIVYTSGTTAQPRGAMLTHEALVRAWMMVGRRWQIGPQDRFWNPLPLFHIAAIGPMVFTLGHGATLLTDAYFEVEPALDFMQAERPTMLYPTYPPITRALLDHPKFAQTDLSSVKVWLNVAPPETLRQMAQAIPQAVQISTYGSTEGGPVVLNELHEEPEARLQSCGPPMPGNEVKIADPINGEEIASSGQRGSAGQIGEILFRGYNTFSGYYKDPDKTAQSIDTEGWVHSGDLGALDENGRLSFHGRLKDMFKVGGENVAPAEVEAYLETHPAVKVAQVVAIPDARLVEVAAAFVELRRDAAVTEAQLIEYCRGRIASFKVPRLVRFITEAQWPMSATKVQRGKLREWLIEELKL